MAPSQILVVEDKAIVARDLQNSLKKLGYVVPATAASAEKALEKAGELRPDLVLMDIRLKGSLDGITAAAEIRDRFDIPVIYLTAHADDETLQRAKLTEPFGYLLKPFEEKELDIAIQIALYKHETERKLRIQERWLAATLDSIADAVLTTGPDGKVIALNPAAQALTGWPLTEARNQEAAEVFKIIDEKTRLPAVSPLAKALQIGSAAGLAQPTLLLTREGREIPIEDTAAPIRNDSDHIIGGVLVFRDVTQQRQWAEQLRQAQKMEVLGQLTAGIAHNFNNMLTSIMGYLELAQETLPADHPANLDLQAVQKTSQRAADMIRQLLTFTRRQITYPTILDLNDLVRSLERILRHLLPETIELVMLIESELVPIKIDPGQMEQVLVNLALNARDAMPKGGKLTIETAKVRLDQRHPSLQAETSSGQFVVLAVTDTGAGMTEEVRARIFEPFFTTKEVGQGTGLGLATCFGIIQQNNGFISVESSPGRGSTFKVYLPRHEIPPAQPAVADKAALPLQGNETILVVEDEAQVRTLITRTLRHYSYNILEAADGEEALEMVRMQPELPIHLLITDMVMPKLGGQVLANLLGVIYPGLKMLFISGYTDMGPVPQGAALLQKPFTPQLLAQKVRQQLDES